MTWDRDPLASLDTFPNQEDDDPAASVRTRHRPFVLQKTCRGPKQEQPQEFHYDPERQIGVDASGQSLAPQLAKKWTSIEETHTDGDGGDNEMWQWEE